MTCFQTLCWHVALKTLSETSSYFIRYPRCCGGWVSNFGPPTAYFWHYCCLTADMSLLLTIDTQIKKLIRNGWKLRKINFPRLRAAVLRIRPDEEDVGQIQPWALGTVLGRGEVPGLCRTWLSRAPACGSWGPALLQTLLGQGLTELGEGSVGSWAHPGSRDSQGGQCPEGLNSQLPKHQEVSYINSCICCQAARCL